MKKLVVIDSNALVHRAFHALPPTLTDPSGAPVNAVYGFTSVLLKMLKDLQPEYVAATFDLAGPTFRHTEYEEYKAHRVKAPDELYAQIPIVKQVLAAFGIPVYEHAGFEADDLIGTLAEHAKKTDDLQVIIMTGDMDTLQLVDGKRVVVFTLRKGVNDTITYDESAVRERYGLPPSRMLDFKGLKGDPSDNIPGVPGIGEKTASALVTAFGTLEELYAYLEQKKGKPRKPLTENLAAKLLEHKDMAFFSKKLATIIRTVPVTFDLGGMDWKSNLSAGNLEETLRGLGFASLIKRLPEVLQIASQDTLIPMSPEIAPLPAPVMLDGELIGHDLKPHLKALLEAGKPLPEKLFDTMVAAWLLEPDHKEYAAEPKEKLLERMTAIGVASVFTDIEMPLIPILARMERLGIRVDVATIQRLLKVSTAAVQALEKKIYALAGTEFNINSPSQLGDILFTKLAIRGRVRRTGGGAPSTAATELEKLREEHPIIDLILEYRELNKLKTTYIEPFPSLVAADGRIHTTYHQTGTGTGRLSSSDPNLQNVPARTELGQQFRASFVANPGFKLVSFDYSQLELRIVAHLAGDATMIATFERGEDIHTRTASEIFAIAPEQVTKDMRRQAKVLNFGIIYGMGVLGFARAAGVARDTAKQFIEEYFARFSGVAAYMERTKEEAFRDGFVTTLFGRRRSLPDIKSNIPQLIAAAERMAINHPVQGTEADLVKLAMIAVDRYLHDQGLGDRARMLLQVHDELVLEIADADVADIVPRIRAIMENIHRLDVPLVVDVKSGDNWSDMTPIAHA
jgi:DNA polymerase-1